MDGPCTVGEWFVEGCEGQLNSSVTQFLEQTAICFPEIGKLSIESGSQKQENTIKLSNFLGLQ